MDFNSEIELFNSVDENKDYRHKNDLTHMFEQTETVKKKNKKSREIFYFFVYYSLLVPLSAFIII